MRSTSSSRSRTNFSTTETQTRHTMKVSKYNHKRMEDGGIFLLNTASNELVIMIPEIARLFLENEGDPDMIRARHPEFYDYLCQKGFLVDGEKDETEAVRERLLEKAASRSTFRMTVNPTLYCNMRCWYCYEGHESRDVMGPETVEAVLNLSGKIAGSGEYRHLSVSFFGGEPLLGYEQAVAPIMRGTAAICNAAGMGVSYHFTTNAFLLDDRMLRDMEGSDVTFQITLDGNQRLHNTIRRTREKQPTYDTIVGNIRKLLDLQRKVQVRLNYTCKSLPAFVDVLDDFAGIPEPQKKLVSFDFQRVWQDRTGSFEEVARQLRSLEEKFQEAGFSISSIDEIPSFMCYADMDSAAVVNYDGRVYKCTARDFTEKNADGRLKADGEIEWNGISEKRKSVRLGGETCGDCKLFPLCHGGCSQRWLDYGRKTGCVKGYGASDIEELLNRHVEFLVSRMRKNTGQNAGGAA